MAERLQKWLAGLGLGSRREIERWIEAGRVVVDDKPATLGMRVTGVERISVDGKPVRMPLKRRRHRTILYHKPPGQICSRNDPQGRPTVFDSLPRLKNARWVSVGRLDFQTAGVLLLTTDGDLANKLMHPSAELEREYSVRVLGDLDDQAIQALVQGVDLDDGRAQFDSLVITRDEAANKSCRVVVTEGRNRIVRRLFEAIGCKVSRLLRLRYGPVVLPRDLKPGKFRDLTAAELEGLAGG